MDIYGNFSNSPYELNHVRRHMMEIMRMENTVNYYKRKEREVCYKETFECSPIPTNYNEYDIPNEDNSIGRKFTIANKEL